MHPYPKVLRDISNGILTYLQRPCWVRHPPLDNLNVFAQMRAFYQTYLAEIL